MKGGLGDFIANTGRSLPMLTGNVVALVAGGVICLIVSYLTSEQASQQSYIYVVAIFNGFSICHLDTTHKCVLPRE